MKNPRLHFLGRLGRRFVASLFAVLALAMTAFSETAPAASASTEWQWKSTVLPKAVVVEGIWAEWFRVDEALDKAGIRTGPEGMGLSNATVVVIVNSAVSRFPAGALARIREFVRAGGGLVVLGGLGAFENGGYAGSPLEEVLPVSISGSYIGHFPSALKGAKLARAEQADWPMAVDFKAGPTAYYFHTLVPAAGAKVQVKVGDQPALISGVFGKGRVVACALTVNGEPDAGVLPFWEWKEWPVVLGQALAWAGGARPAGVAPPQGPAAPSSAAKGAATSADLGLAELGLAELPKDFVKQALAHPDEATAKTLLDLATTENGEATCTLDVVLPAILPYAKPEWADKLKTAADTWNPNLETRKAALILMGASRSPLAYDLLVKAVKEKKTELAAMEGLGRLGQVEAIPVLRRRLKEVLAPARLRAGPDRWEPVEFSDAARPAAYAAIALYRLGDPDGVAGLCALARDLNLYRRIMLNASQRWPRDPQGKMIKEMIVDCHGKFQAAWAVVVDQAGPIPAVQGEAFVRYAMTVEDPVLIEFLAGAMEKSAGKAPPANWSALSGARSGILARMSAAVMTSAVK